MRRRELLALLASGAGGAASRRAAAAEPALRAWVGGRVLSGERFIERATLVTRAERIESIQTGGAVPEGAAVTELGGALVVPGFVGAETALGLVEVSAEQTSLDSQPHSLGADEPIRAGYAASDGFNRLSSLIGVARRGGVTSVIATPQQGVVSGTSAWFDLEEPYGPRAAGRAVAMHASVEAESRPAAWRLLRDALLEARLFARSRGAYERGQTKRLRLRTVDLQALAAVVEQRVPLVLRVARADDIVRAVRLAREMSLRLVISGGEEAWVVAPQLAEAEVPVVLRPSANLPSSFSALRSRPDSAALLAAAGVPLTIATFGAHDQHNLRQEAGLAVAHGLSSQSALSAISSAPALWAGLAASHGRLVPGFFASFSVWQSDPFEPSSWPTAVVVRGNTSRLVSRQTLLFERYRDLSRVPRGVVGLP